MCIESLKFVEIINQVWNLISYFYRIIPYKINYDYHETIISFLRISIYTVIFKKVKSLQLVHSKIKKTKVRSEMLLIKKTKVKCY